MIKRAPDADAASDAHIGDAALDDDAETTLRAILRAVRDLPTMTIPVPVYIQPATEIPLSRSRPHHQARRVGKRVRRSR